MQLFVTLEGKIYQFDTAEGQQLHLSLRFERPQTGDLPTSPAPQPSTYGVPKASARAYQDGEFVGDTRAGGSCNFEQVTLVPHCNGTHTECVGHLTHERVYIEHVLRDGLFPATIVTVQPERMEDTSETTEPAPQAGDVLITRKALEAALAQAGNPGRAHLEGLCIRTLPNEPEKASRDYGVGAPPYFSREAMEWVVAQGVRHLLVDTPSLDRLLDAGRLTAHRVFFGLPPVEAAESRSLSAARRPMHTVTELVYLGEEIPDGPCILQVQLPPFVSDAAPSRVFRYGLVPVVS